MTMSVKARRAAQEARKNPNVLSLGQWCGSCLVTVVGLLLGKITGFQIFFWLTVAFNVYMTYHTGRQIYEAQKEETLLTEP